MLPSAFINSGEEPNNAIVVAELVKEMCKSANDGNSDDADPHSKRFIHELIVACLHKDLVTFYYLL